MGMWIVARLFLFVRSRRFWSREKCITLEFSCLRERELKINSGVTLKPISRRKVAWERCLFWRISSASWAQGWFLLLMISTSSSQDRTHVSKSSCKESFPRKWTLSLFQQTNSNYKCFPKWGGLSWTSSMSFKLTYWLTISLTLTTLRKFMNTSAQPPRKEDP